MKLPWSRKEPGFLVSAAGHAAVLAALLAGLASAPRFDDQEEAIPVEVITDDQLRAITRGEKTAREVAEKPALRASAVAPVRDVKPDPAEVESHAPAPPSRPRDLAVAEDNAPPPPQKPEPRPEPKPAPKQETAPLPPQRPEPAPEPAPKPQPKPEPKPQPRPEPRPEPRPKPDPAARRDLARLIEETRPQQKPAEKPAARPAPEGESFNPTDIRRLLASRGAGQRSSAPEPGARSTAGSQTATGPKLSMSQRDALGALIKEQLRRCFSYVGAPPEVKPEVRMQLAPDGSLTGPPALLNSSVDPAFRAMADATLRAIRMCAPFQVPAQYAPYYNDWRSFRIIADQSDFL